MTLPTRFWNSGRIPLQWLNAFPRSASRGKIPAPVNLPLEISILTPSTLPHLQKNGVGRARKPHGTPGETDVGGGGEDLGLAFPALPNQNQAPPRATRLDGFKDQYAYFLFHH